MSDFTDEELVDEYLTTRCNDYFEQLYQRYCTKVHRTCLSFTKDSGQADDLTQDIFIRLITKLDGYKKKAAFSTWLYAITHNYCADQVRKFRCRREVMIGEDWDTLPLAVDDSTIQEEATPHLIEAAIRTLSTNEQFLLRQRYEEGLSIRALAAYHSLTESAVKMRLKRSRDQIQAFYRQLAAH